MRVIMEVLFDIIYLILVITIGLTMCIKSKENKQFRMFGIMAFVLGVGDAFHLIPRVYSLITDSMSENVVALGFGKFITSISMTAFYVILYHIWNQRYNIQVKSKLTLTIYILSIIRIMLCLFPQNNWLSEEGSMIWGIYRNIPFTILGIIIIYIFFNKAKETNDIHFRYAWVAVLFSFAFYIPVVLWADTISIIGMLMIPKTICYLWLIMMGYKEYKELI